MKRARLASDDALPAIDGLVPPWPGRSVVVDGARTHLRDTPPRSADAEPAVMIKPNASSNEANDVRARR